MSPNRSLLVFLLGLLAPAWGLMPAQVLAAGQTLDLLAVYGLAVENDARLDAARHRFLAGSEVVPQARAALLPELSFTAEHVETNQDIQRSDNPVFARGSTDFSTDNYTLNLTIPLFDYAAWARYSQARHERRRSRTELMISEQDLVRDVVERYFDVLAARDTLDYARANRRSIDRELEAARSRHEHGLASSTELFDARARASEAEARVIEARSGLQDARDRLSELTGGRIGTLVAMREQVPLIRPDPEDIGQWVATARRRNLELIALREAVEVASREVRRRRSGHYPRLDLVGRLNERDTGGTLFGGGSDVVTSEYLLRLTVPLYQGGAVSSATRQAREALLQARRELVAGERKTLRETRSAYHATLRNLKQVEALRQSLAFQEKALEARETGFHSGINSMLDVLDAQREVFHSRSAYARARYDLLRGIIALKRVSGTLVAGDLKALNDLLGPQGR